MTFMLNERNVSVIYKYALKKKKKQDFINKVTKNVADLDVA